MKQIIVSNYLLIKRFLNELSYLYKVFGRFKIYRKTEKKQLKIIVIQTKIDLQNNQFENTTLLRIYKNSENGDTLIIYKLDVLGTTTYSILNVMTKFFKKGVNINILNKNNNYLNA